MNSKLMVFKKNLTKCVCGLLLVHLSFLILVSAAFAQTDETNDDPAALFNKGQDAHEKGDLTAALKFYDEALKIIPEFPEAEYQRGMAFIQLNKSDEAEKAFRRALEIREDWTLAMAKLGALLVRKDSFAEAEKLLEKAIELDEQNFPAFDALAELRLKTNASAEILEALLAKIRRLTSKANPTASILTSQGALERRLGNVPAAKKSIQRALAIDPKNNLALIEFVELAIAEGDYRRAMDAAKALNENAPGSILPKIVLARVLRLNGKTDEAAKIVDALDQNDPAVAEFKQALAEKENESVESLEKRLAENANDIAVLERLCVLMRTGQPEKSLEYCRRAAELEPGNINHAVGFGAALVQAKKFAEAANLLYKIKETTPDNYTVRANLAAALFQLKNFEKAKIEYRWLTEKQPDLAVGYYFLAIAHDSLEEYLDAMANYQQFLRLADPKVNQLEIDKVNLRLPSLQKLIKQTNGKKKKGK